VTVKNFWHDRYIPDTEAVYRLTSNKGLDQIISRPAAAKLRNDPELPVGFTITRHLVTEYVRACAWCGARPLQYERDCDGWASTGTCGSDQCDQLQRCEGCGETGTAAISSVRGKLCDTCNDIARETGQEAARDRYALVPFSS
jgi:hypothetical protein